MESDRLYEIPEFDGRNVPVTEAARLMGKDQQFIRQAMIRGILPIGLAFKKTIRDGTWGNEKESSQYDFYISPKLLWEYTGIVYRSKDTNS
ncbi:MAG: hypothetical protein LUF78_08950 [Clostridiales bacterium]|nr:hypothetical protein [Clostridiales bacterium]